MLREKTNMLPIVEVARNLGIYKKELKLFGDYIAKVDLGILPRLRKRKKGKYIFVTAITPTPLGEGKTVTTIGLSMALNKLGELTSACLRQSSLGPVFGIKGGAAGSGHAQVLPSEDVNLHFTGDIHAVGLAHNLCAAFLDNSIFQGNHLKINPESMGFKRVMDVSDRRLRACGFDITSASEIMAVVALSKSLKELRRHISKIVLADTYEGKPVTAEDIKVAGAIAALLKDAIRPNLVQTKESTPCFIHSGPFGNIAHGSSSILADEIALALSDYVVTESGFGADLGAEKFIDIKCRYSGFRPDCAVLVCSVRALKVHSGRYRVVPGKPLDRNLLKENLKALEDGLCNLKKQIENVRLFGIPVVVAINRFDTDSDRELSLIIRKSVEFGADACCISEVWKRGSSGGIDLAIEVIRAARKNNNFKFLYPLGIPIKEKIKTIATKVYGAKDVEYSDVAEEKIRIFTKHGWGRLPICMAKTHLSLSHEPHMKGAPRNFILPIRDMRASVGAGFLYPLCGDIQTMPGLPAHPRGEKIDIDEKGNIIGLL